MSNARQSAGLQTWASAPRSPGLIARFRGSAEELREIVRTYLRQCGAATIDAAVVIRDGRRRNGHLHELDYFVRLAETPANSLVEQLLRNPGCRLFYRRIAAGADRLAESAPASSSSAGPYFEWGFEPIRPADWRPDQLVDRHGVTEGLPPDEQFACVLERHPEWEFRFGDADRPVGLSRATAATGAACHELPIQLVNCVAHRAGDPAAVEQRLCREIRERTEQLEMHKYLYPERGLTIEMRVYPEMPADVIGSDWRLRNWVFRTPQHVLSQYRHARLELDDGLIVHLVTTADLRETPHVAPPQPRLGQLLVLDWRWHASGRQIFVPQGWELSPPPPLGKPLIADAITKSLWDGASPDKVLVIMRHNDRVRRFVVDELRPLSDQVETLNLRLTIDKMESLKVDRKSPEFRGALEAIETRLAEKLDDLCQRITGDIDRVVTDDFVDLARYRQRAHDLVAIVDELAAWDDRIARLRESRWDEWEQFRDTVLDLDARSQPSVALRPLVQHAHQLMHDLTRLWRNDTDAARAALAGRIRTLADQLIGPTYRRSVP